MGATQSRTLTTDVISAVAFGQDKFQLLWAKATDISDGQIKLGKTKNKP